MNDVLRKTGASKIQVQTWCLLGIVIPFRDNSGRGNRRRYSDDNLRWIKIFKGMADHYMPSALMKTVAKSQILDNAEIRMNKVFDLLDGLSD